MRITKDALKAQARKTLEMAGFDFSSKENIERFEHDYVIPTMENYRKEEAQLREVYAQILIEAGATEMQLKWGNVSQANPNLLQRMQMKKVEGQIERIRGGILVSAAMLDVLNEAKEVIA